MLRAALLACALAARAAPPACTRPVVGDYLQPLDSSAANAWTLSNGSGAPLHASVPGDLITDLEANGVVPDPLVETNFRGNATSPAAVGGVVWDAAPWTYSLSFALAPALAAAAHVSLVFEGVKMVADVALNGVALGFTANQFLRYEYDATAGVARAGANVLTVTFPTFADARNVERRWMACSGAWDWAPYSTTKSVNVTTFTKGIWRSLYLVGVARASAAIAHVAPRVFYKGAYPTAPLADGAHGDFSVDVVVHFAAPAATTGSLTIAGAWGAAATVPVALPAGASNVTVTLAAADNSVKLWWPALTPISVGAQTLYNLSAAFTEAGGAAAKVATRRVGFRVFTLVTGNDTDPAALAGKDGTGAFTMRVKVNGADIWARGANVIPMEELEGRATDAAHRRLVQSAAEGGFNLMRIWGGGIWQHDAFYDACDELGILLYHDAMYAGYFAGSHTPAATPAQDAELRHQVRRLAEHPSVAMYDACNECSGSGLYSSFVSATIAEEDPSRTPWPASPSKGWASGVDALTGLPNGRPLVEAGASGGGAADAPPAAARRAARARNASCAFVANEDYAVKGAGPLPSVPAAAPQDCCDLCAAHEGCAAATFDGKNCLMKTAAQAALPFFSQNRVGVWLPGSGPVPDPIPPPPPPGALRCAPQAGEAHGPYQHGGGFKTRNSPAALQPFTIALPPNLPEPALTGPRNCHGSFTSEFGAVSTPSFESLAPTLRPEHWALHAAPMFERNYAVDSFVVAASNAPWPAAFNATGEADFKAKLYFAMLAQALFVKGAIEAYRAANVWGVLLWQLNEVWPTGGWGSVEYGTAGFTPGQVEGGRWKPLHYWLRRHLYTDAFVAASRTAQVLVRNDDAFAPLVGTAAVSLLHLATGAATPLAALPVALPRGAGATAWSCVDARVDFRTATCPGWPALLAPSGCAADGTDCIALLALTRADGSLAAENFELLAQPFSLALPAARVTFAVGAAAAGGTVLITLTADKTALFVTLTTRAQGRFSANAFALPPGSAAVDFICWGPCDAAALAATLRVEHLAGAL